MDFQDSTDLKDLLGSYSYGCDYYLLNVYSIYAWVLSKIAQNWLEKELVESYVNPPVGFKHKVADHLQRVAPYTLNRCESSENRSAKGSDESKSWLGLAATQPTVELPLL
ncbi:hypothetical protein Droror1_Dr00017565 [Drosera rotundifolia]